APAVFWHPDIIEFGPALGIDADRRAQIHKALLEADGSKVVPPVEIARVPFFESSQNLSVARQPHIIGDLGVVAYVDQVSHFLLPKIDLCAPNVADGSIVVPAQAGTHGRSMYPLRNRLLLPQERRYRASSFISSNLTRASCRRRRVCRCRSV